MSKVEQNSLTSPSDMDPEKPYRPDSNANPLTVEETNEAFKELYVGDFITKFPKRERAYADPIYSNQVYCLHSFVPSHGAKPDKDGVYGMIKFRGTFPNQEEATARTEYLIRNVDSYHTLYLGWAGRPFPATVDSKYSAEKSEVDIRKKTTEIISKDIKEKKAEEKRTVDDIKEREKNLLDSAREEKEEEPAEVYTTLRVKKAQLIWTYLETMKKVEQMKESIIQARKDIEEMNAKDPEFEKAFYDKYMEARRTSHLPDDDESFMKYLLEDEELGF